MFNEENLYVIGSIILFCIILNQKLNSYTIEGMCLCGGPQLPGDERVRYPREYQKRIEKCGYDTHNFSSVL
jgi:hypothetical protein